MTSILELENIGKSFAGVPAVSDVFLEVPRGQRLAIIGPNGAGKSTLFGMISGEVKPTQGAVVFDGKTVTSDHSSRRAVNGMSRTFQVARLMTSMTVRENVFLAALTGRRRGIRFWDAWSSNSDAWDRADAVLEQSGLTDIADETASALAQGARKSLEMAMAIVQEPSLLLLDEPTAGMGFEDARAATEQLRELLDARREMTIILTAHDMEVIHRVSERVVLLAGGRTMLDGTPDEVAADPVTRELYLGQGES